MKLRVSTFSLVPVALFALAAALLTGCVKSGSETGPALPELGFGSATGVVIDPAGRPVSNAYVTVDGELKFTDSQGRFRFNGAKQQPKIVEVDARRTASTGNTTGIYDRIVVEGSFLESPGVFAHPVVMPDFSQGASANIAVNTGAALAGTLTDPATGAELLLTGAVATIPGSTATAATIRFVTFPADRTPKPLDVQGVARAGALYFAIAPADLEFTVPPVVRVGDAIHGIAAALGNAKAVNPELDVLDPTTGRWALAGSAAVGGGFLSSGAVADGGIYCISTASPFTRRTIITARVLDQNLEPLRGALAFSRDGRSSVADKDGLLAIPDVPAADADDAVLPVSLSILPAPFLYQQALRKDTIPGKPGAGQITDFEDRPVPTLPAGRIRVLPLFEGQPAVNSRIGASGAFQSVFDASHISTKKGTEFWDVPVGPFILTAVREFDENLILRIAQRRSVPTAGATVDINMYLRRTRLQSFEQKGNVRSLALRGMSLTPVFNSFHMVGVDGESNQNGFSPGGLAGFGKQLPGPVLSTAGQEVEVPALGSDGIDLYRRRVFHSQRSTGLFRRSIIEASIDRMPPGGFDRACGVFGNASGLTNPAVVAPLNGHYAVEVRTTRFATFEERVGVALGAKREVEANIPSFAAKRPEFTNANYEGLAPIGRATVALVERDAVSPDAVAGPITRFGFVTNVETDFGRRLELDINVSSAATLPLPTTVQGGIDPQTVSVVFEPSGGPGIDLGRQEFTFNGGTKALAANVPAAAQRSALIAGASFNAANGSLVTANAAAVTGEGNMRFLTPPVIAAPAPLPGEKIQINPTVNGISWAADPETHETLLTLTRRGTGPQSDGKVIKIDNVWTVRLPGSPSNFVFPQTPVSAKNVPVPVFFESGAVYTLTIEVRRYLDYDERTAATSPEAAQSYLFAARAVSRATVDVQIP